MITNELYLALLVFLLGSCLCNGLNLTLYERTCYSAAISVFPSNSYCSFVTWNTGNFYSRRFFDLYSPGTAFTVANRDSVARRYGNDLNTFNETSSACTTAISWLACSSVFPHCPAFSGAVSTISFLEPCRFQCEQVNDACRTDLDCSVYATTSCTFYVPPSYVVLSPTKGPYKSMPKLYAAFIAIWGASALGWGIWAYIYRQYSTPKFVLLIGLIFLLRFSIALVCRSFWLDCSEYLYICDSAIFGYTVPLLRLLETIQFFALLLLTRGIAVTRPSLLFSEYFCAIVSSFVFFAVSISVSAFIAQAPSIAWIVFTTIIYVLLYVHLLSLISIQIRHLRGISSKLTGDMPADIIAPIKEKEFAFKVFFFLLIGFITIEISGQCMYALSYISMESLVIGYEVPSWVLLFALGWYFRPRKYSPYFFMLPADSSDTAALQEGQNRVLPVIVVQPDPAAPAARTLFGSRATNTEHENLETEIELSPLLPGHDSWGFTSQKRLVVLQSSEGEVAMGLRGGDGAAENRARSLRALFNVR